MALARLTDDTVNPKVLSRSSNSNGYIPIFLELPRYFSRNELMESAKSLKELVITAIHPDISRNRTLVLGFTIDGIVQATLFNKELKNMTTGPMYSRINYEAIPIVSVNREDLFTAEKILRSAAKGNDGNAYLDIMGRVTSIRDLANLHEIFNPEPSVVPGLSRGEARILEEAIAYGYYESPRKINQEKLAEKLGMPKSTLSQLMRTIENRIVNNTLFDIKR